MQSPALPSLRSRLKSFTDHSSHSASRPGLFDTHPIAEVARNLFFSSVLWGLLAVAVYTVYSLVV